VLDVGQLTRGLVQGDDAAYRVVFDLYYARLRRYLLAVTGGDELAAEEALEGAFRRAARYPRVFQEEAALWSWLTVLAKSALIDEHRKRRRYLAFLDRFRRHPAPAPIPALTSDPGESACAAEALDRNFALLPAADQALLAAKYFDREPVRSIAARLAVTEKTIESRLTRLRRKLKAAILAEQTREPIA
jgi:RNA polymerase sigma factor (sigma-70 family)